MAPKDCAKTAFRMLWGLFEFLQIPLGLNGAVATVQRLMDSLLAPHVAYAAAYIDDDIVIFTKSGLQHIQVIKAILGEFRTTRLTANQKKNVLAGKKIKYLGFLVGQGFIKLLMDKVDTIHHFQAPHTRR